MTPPPRLSILVATWNCAPLLLQFLESLAVQSWSDWELLLLDNASTDGTAELVGAFQQTLSEGPHTFVDTGSLERIAALTASGADLITARNAYYAPDGRLLRHWGFGWQWKRMRQSMNIAHPGMLVRRALFERFGPFDASFRICGDYEWLLRLPPDLRAIHSSDPILKVVQAGVSHTRIGRVYAETFRAQRRHLSAPVSAACWALNWAKYGRRRLIGLA
jgi:glycosyltransferase involved in cell wall biosynthesis